MEGVEPVEAAEGSGASDAPAEVEHDAIAELERIHQAQKFNVDTDEGYDASYGFSTPALSYEPVAPTDDPVAAPSRELKTLEDLYEAYPKIGDGQFYLRITRKHPASFNGLRVAGFLEDSYSRLTMTEFAARFGGHSYEVSVCGPGRSSSIGSDGRIQMRTLKTIRLEVPGTPIMLAPTNGDDMTSSAAPFLHSPPSVKIKEMEIAADKQRRLEAREAKWQSDLSSRGRDAISPSMLQAIEQAADRRAGEVKDFASSTIDDLRDRVRRDYEAIQSLRAELTAKDQNLVAIQTDYATKLREEETRQVRELKTRYDSEFRRSKEEHAVTIQRITDEQKRLTSEASERGSRERENIQKQEKIERDRMREDSTRRERQLIDDARMREDNTRQNYESRLSELQRSLEREVRSIKEQRDREVLNVQSTESTKTVLTEKTAKIQVESMRNELARLHAELDGARREMEHMRAQVNKTPEEAIEQAHRLASMTGFGGGEKESDELDWKRGVVSAVKGLIDKAPEIAEGFGRARETNRAAAGRAQQQRRVAHQRAQMTRQQQQPQYQSAQMSQAPPPPQQPNRVRRPTPPGMGSAPPAWDAGPPAPGVAPGLPPVPGGPPVPQAQEQQTQHHFDSPPPPEMQGPPLQDPQPAPLSPTDFGRSEGPDTAPPVHTHQQAYAPSVAPVAEPAPAPTPAPAPPPASVPARAPAPVAQPVPPVPPPPMVDPAPEQAAPIEVTEDMVGKFAEKLDTAIASGLVTPLAFARGFIEEAGPEVTARIIGAIGPDQLVDAVQAQDATDQTAIVTLDGRKYVRELWAEATKLLEQGAST